MAGKFQTHVGLILEWMEKDGLQCVLFYSKETKEHPKVLYEGRSVTEAKEMFDYTKAVYEQHAIAAEFLCDEQACSQRGRHSAEAHVPYVRKGT